MVDAAYWRLMNSIPPTIAGMRIATIQAPCSNFSTSTITRTTSVISAPLALTISRHRQPESRPRNQWTTMPLWLRVKQTNTPTEYSGIRLVVLPWKATYRPAAMAARRMIPQL